MKKIFEQKAASVIHLADESPIFAFGNSPSAYAVDGFPLKDVSLLHYSSALVKYSFSMSLSATMTA